MSPVPLGTFAVTNPSDFIRGRFEETDEELRLRMSEQESSTGTATIPAIQASLSEVDGVTRALVLENPTFVVDAAGRPPKSFEALVRGGDDDEVAQVVWDTKPAGIETFGTITKIVTDINGTDQVVKFSRPVQKYAWVNVTYSLYTEEVFPVDGEVAMAQSVVQYGDSIEEGIDIIPQRFNGVVFDSTDGVLSVEVEIGITLDDISPPASYTTLPIPISEFESVDFDLSRVVVSI